MKRSATDVARDKREVMASFFDDFEARVTFLADLASSGHEDEARVFAPIASYQPAGPP